MGKPLLKRRIFALAAAYVVALQALLLPLSVAAGSPYISILCTSSTGNTQMPASHESGCPCAAGCGMQCGSHALTGSSQVTVAPALTPGCPIMETPALVPVMRPGIRSPQNPRAPPVA